MIMPVDLVFPIARSERYIGETKMWEVSVTPPAMSGFDCTSRVLLTEAQHARYCRWLAKGGLIEEAFPELSDQVREQLLSGITPEAWDKAFRDSDRDE